MNTASAAIAIHLTFTPEDLAWAKEQHVTVPPFWSGHPIGPALGDVIRLADRQFVVTGRAWEHNGQQPLLRLYMSASSMRSDTSLH